MAIMGWSQVSMLARYQHVVDAMLTDARERLEAADPIAVPTGTDELAAVLLHGGG
jgi:hypothetical protein